MLQLIIAKLFSTNQSKAKLVLPALPSLDLVPHGAQATKGDMVTMIFSAANDGLSGGDLMSVEDALASFGLSVADIAGIKGDWVFTHTKHPRHVKPLKAGVHISVDSDFMTIAGIGPGNHSHTWRWWYFQRHVPL